jgi:L-ribulose-5-phosphate 3-epimerase
MSAPKIAFNTANLVGRVTGYRFDMAAWGAQHDKTAAAMNEREWAAICAEVAAAGFHAVEVWTAHVDPRFTDEPRARLFRRILDDHGLTPVGLAGSLTRETARVCLWMEMPVANGGFWGTTLAEVRSIIASTGIRCNFENHPEKSSQELLDKIEGGTETLGLCVDTGWLGTNGVDAVAAVKTLGRLVRNVHVKDVREAGSHHTCPLGEGCVGIPAVIAALHKQRYAGWYSWEDEPEDRNPMDIASKMRESIEGWLQAAGA